MQINPWGVGVMELCCWDDVAAPTNREKTMPGGRQTRHRVANATPNTKQTVQSQRPEHRIDRGLDTKRDTEPATAPNNQTRL